MLCGCRSIFSGVGTFGIRARKIGIVGGKRKVPSPVIQTRAVDKLEYQSDQCLGIRTRATVENGVKEDAKKRKPGLIIKNKICNSERDSFFDRIRLNSSLGGQSSNILSAKPKIFRHFRKLNRKKIYRPKKHSVSIQIPRKGYFYRSTVHSPSQESPSAALRRMELLIEPKIKSKVEISGLASTSAKVSDLPVEKTVKGKRKRVDEGEVSRRCGPEAEALEPPSPELLERLTRAANDEASSYTFRHMLDEYLSSISTEESSIEGDDPLDEMLFLSLEAKGNIQTSAIFANPTSPNFQDSKNPRRTSPRVGDDFSELLEFWSENVFPTDDNQNNCGLQVAFDPLFHPIDSALGREIPTSRLRNPSLSLIREESSESVPSEGVGADEDSSLPAGAGRRRCGNSQGEQIFTSEGRPKDVDLPLVGHATDTDDFTSKTNALQIDVFEADGFSRSGNARTEREEFFDVDESKSGSSYSSAVSFCPPQVSGGNRPTPASADLSRPTRLKKFISLTRLGEKPEETKKSKSENDLGRLKSGVSRKTRLLSEAMPERPEPPTRNSVDRYEKIILLDTAEAKSGPATSELTGTEEEAMPRDEEIFPGSSRRCRSGWSPTLPELTEIYRSILRESKRINRKDANSSNRCFSSHILKFLKQKLKEKQLRKDLVDFSKTFRDSFRPIHWKSGKVEDPSYGLTEYVNVFQEILHSSLSVKQIVGLNNTLEGFYNYHEKTHELLTDLWKGETETDVWSKQQQKDSKTQKKICEGTDSGAARAPWKNEMQRMTLSTPTDLETVLKRFNSEAGFDRSVTDVKSKLLVTVKLSGNQVLVSSFAYFSSDETSLLQEKTEKGTSELIIENMTKCYPDRLALQEKKKRSCKTGKIAANTATNAKKKDRNETAEAEERPKEVPERPYDQLRARHPIEVIPEGPEAKIEGNDENSKTKSEIVRENDFGVSGIKGALREALAGKIYLRELFAELGRGEEIGKAINGTFHDGPQAKRRPSPKKKQAETVRSMFELKKSASGETPNLPSARPRSTYFCYPSVTSLQEKLDKKKPIEKGKGGCTPATFKAKQTKNAFRPPSKWNTKKPPKEPNRKKLEPVALQRCAAGKAPTEERKEPTPVRETSKASGGELSPPDGEGASDCCSVELLVYDDAAEIPPLQTDAGRDATPPEQLEDSPILLHRSRSSADGTSFRSEIIHSDSFLKYCTPLRVTQSQLKSLFKCNSEVKFYPGRVREGSDDCEPFVTFVLTPKQNETAGLPSDMVRVVEKKRAMQPTDAQGQSNRHEGSLGAIERFIAEMSELRRAALAKQRQSAIPKKIHPNSGKCEAKDRGSVQNGGHQSERPPERKAYHECQKRKLASDRRNPPVTGGGNPGEKQRSVLEKSEVSLGGSAEKECEVGTRMLKMKNLEVQKADTREMMRDKSTEMHSFESKVEAFVTDIAEAEWNPERDEKEDYVNVSAVPGDMLEAIKVAIARVEGFDTKEKIIQAIEDVEKKQTQKESDVAEASSSRPKKSKTLRIKIRCRGLKPSENGGEVRRPEERKMKNGKLQNEGPTPEIALLDSLVARDEEDRILKGKKSTYFDALQKNLEEKAGGTRRVAKDYASRSVGCPGEGVPEPSSDLPAKERTCQPSLTPSDEGLLSAVSDKKETEEMIYKKISKYMEEGDVSHSMTLLDRFLKKTENSLDDTQNLVRLRELLSLIENKSRNLMMSLENNVWLKVLSLMEEAARLLEDEGVQNSKKAQLLQKIHSLNIRKLIDLQMSRASSESVAVDDGNVGHVLGVLRESLSFLKRKVAGKRSRGAESFEDFEGEGESSESAIRIHSAEGLPEMREGATRSADNGGDFFGTQTKSEESKRPREGSRAEVWPFGPGKARMRGEGKKSPGDGLCRRPGYVDLVRYFMKAWDARMSLSSLSKCRI